MQIARVPQPFSMELKSRCAWTFGERQLAEAAEVFLINAFDPNDINRGPIAKREEATWEHAETRNQTRFGVR